MLHMSQDDAEFDTSDLVLQRPSGSRCSFRSSCSTLLASRNWIWVLQNLFWIHPACALPSSRACRCSGRFKSVRELLWSQCFLGRLLLKDLFLNGPTARIKLTFYKQNSSISSWTVYYIWSDSRVLSTMAEVTERNSKYYVSLFVFIATRQ